MTRTQTRICLAAEVALRLSPAGTESQGASARQASTPLFPAGPPSERPARGASTDLRSRPRLTVFSGEEVSP